MPLYEYVHPKTKKIYESIRKIDDRDKPFIAEDGTECQRILFPEVSGWIIEKEREVFEIAPDYAKSIRPKFVRYRDGHRERFDPTRHC